MRSEERRAYTRAKISLSLRVKRVAGQKWKRGDSLRTTNISSSGVLAYLGIKGTENGQRTGAQVLGGLNGLVGLLGVLGVNNLAGMTMNQGMGGNIVNLLIGVWGLYAGFANRKTATA